MTKDEVLKKIPENGFLKANSKTVHTLSGAQKTALVRRGNELFNRKEYEQAKRIFLTIGYTDGIIRIGDLYYKNNKVIEALRMYMLAPAPDRKEKVVQKMAAIVQTWLHEKS